MVKPIIHYAGRIVWAGGSVLPGWAACCYGERAIAIRAAGHHTFVRDAVTCKACLKKIAAMDSYLRKTAFPRDAR
jgi:hypothetical protein